MDNSNAAHTPGPTEFVGFCRRGVEGYLAIIGIGDEEWLRGRIPFDGRDFTMRPATAGDYEEPPTERDFSGAGIGDGYEARGEQ